MNEGTFKIEWEAHEYEHKERSHDWFWAVGIATVGIAIASIIFGNIIFAILILVSVFALTLFVNREPESIRVILDEKGISKDKVLYPFDTLHSFWIDTDHPHKKILLRSKKLLMPYIIIPLGDNPDKENLKKKLSNYIKEEYHRLSFAETILEYLGF
ncbi:MAG: hypothetical protein AB200_02140 [Parcubacteria bacterium C7867-005]|nr:MAG: hypothetical protein AB200_02140 [Parcubacteria bacterium C7867-005]